MTDDSANPMPDCFGRCENSIDNTHFISNPVQEGMPMYKNYFFDLYGTLVDIRTDEQKPSLWRDLAEFYSLCGAS